MSEDTETSPVLDEETAQPKRSRRRILKALAIIATVGLVGGRRAGRRHCLLRQQVRQQRRPHRGGLRQDPESTRPIKPVDTGRNYLLVGSDIRAKEPTTGSAAPSSGGGLSDVIMVIHVTADKKAAYVISTPRDSWVDIPGRDRKYKTNGAYSLGGPSLVVQTVEKPTGIRIDHYLAIDMRSFAAMTDAVGGVDINVPINSYDSVNRKRWKAGPQRMDGETALLFVRQRSLAFSLRGLRGDAVHFLTVPVKGFGRVGAAAVVFLDPARGEVLYQAVRIDNMAASKPSPAK